MGGAASSMMAADAGFRNAWTDAQRKQAHGARVSSLSGSPRAEAAGRGRVPREVGGEEGPATRSSRLAERFVTGAYDRRRKQADSALVAHVGTTLADLPESGIVI